MGAGAGQQRLSCTRSQAALGGCKPAQGFQASFEVQPRVFYEGFPKLVLYVQDVKSGQGAAIWKGVFIADISNPASPRITLAREGFWSAKARTCCICI